MKMIEVVLSSLSEKIVILQAMRDIVTFERCLTTVVKRILVFLQNFKLVSGTVHHFSNQFRIYNSLHLFSLFYISNLF